MAPIKIPTDITIPSDLHARGDISFSDKITVAVRESYANVVNYEGDKIHFFFAWHRGNDYLVAATTSKPFKGGLQEIIDLGVTPNRSGGENNAFQGCGLVAVAFLASYNPHLVVASWDSWGEPASKKNLFIVGGSASEEGNKYIVEDLSVSWHPIMEGWFGSRFKEFTVFYCFAMTGLPPRTNEDRVLLSGKNKTSLFSTVPFMAPSFNKNRLGKVINATYAEKEIGFPYTDSKTRKNYSSLDGGYTDSRGTTGSFRRRILSYDAFLERFLHSEGRYEIPCEPFQCAIKSTLVATIQKARIELLVFPGRFTSSDKAGYQWLVSERAGEIDGLRWGKDTGSDIGRMPEKKAFLYIPYAAKVTNPDHRAAHARFEDNALFCLSQPGPFMNLLGLQYFAEETVAKKPFVVIRVFIDEISKITTVNPRTNREESPCPCGPWHILGYLERRPEFLVANNEGAQHLMKDACKAAFKNVPLELKVLCQEIFPNTAPDCVQIYESEESVNENTSRSICPITIFDMQKWGEVFDKNFEIGQLKLLALWHAGEKRFLTACDLSTHGSTRGVSIRDEFSTKHHVGGAANLTKITANILSSVQTEDD